MRIVLAGISHRTAPVTLREQLTVAPARLADATQKLLCLPGVREAMILSTCNRTELTVACDPQTPDFSRFLAEFFGIAETQFLGHMYSYNNIDAAQHLFRVASSLDSLVLGEPQILGQVKTAYAIACSVGAVGSNLQLLSQSAFATAKKVRSETRIGSAPISVASVAVDLIGKVIGSLRGRRILVAGAGKIGGLAAARLMRHGPESVAIASRRFENALDLAAQLGGHAIHFESVRSAAAVADVVITSTGTSGYLFRREDAGELMHARTSRPLFFVDIAVPRDVDPELRREQGIFVYDIDSLQSVSSVHRNTRSCEAEKAEMIVAQEAIRYQRRAVARDIAPTIRGVQAAMEALTQTELRRSQSRLRGLTPDQQNAIRYILGGVTNKILHSMIRCVKQAAANGDSEAIGTICALFGVSPPSLLQAGEGDSDPLAMDNDLAGTIASSGIRYTAT